MLKHYWYILMQNKLIFFEIKVLFLVRKIGANLLYFTAETVKKKRASYSLAQRLSG